MIPVNGASEAFARLINFRDTMHAIGFERATPELIATAYPGGTQQFKLDEAKAAEWSAAQTPLTETPPGE